MRLTALSVFNVGVFSGKHSFSFNPNGLTCFLGKNGSGKTTLFQCIQLGLFGKNSPFFKYSSYKGLIAYKDYLKSLVNKRKHKSASIEVFFEETQSGCNNSFIAKRTWNSEGIEHFDFYQNERKVVINEDFHQQLAALMNPGAANLYFFDGEQVDYWSDIKHIRHFLQSALSSFLGIDILEKSVSALKGLAERFSRNNNLKSEEQEKQATIDRTSFLEAQVAGVEAEKKVHRSKVYLEDCHTNLKQAGHIPHETREVYLKRINDLNDHAGNLNKIINRSKSAELRLRSNIEILFNLIDERDRRILHDLDVNVSAVVERLLHKHCLNKIEILKAFQIEDISELTSELKTTKKEIETIKKSLNEVSSDTKIKALVILFQEAQKQLQKDELQLELTTKLIKDERNKVLVAEQQILSRQEVIKDELKRNIQTRTHSMNIDKSIEALQLFSDFIIKEKVQQLNKRVLNLFNILYHKRNFISNLKIQQDSNSLDILLFDKDMQLSLSQLSAGERQLFALAIIGAIGEVSNFKIPFVIDTPLSRLDIQHRKNFVRSFLSDEKRQSIVFATDDEVKYISESDSSTMIDLTLQSENVELHAATEATL
jgi:DNA sulfur modification protein DndD